jgi:protein-S-isoprenylcysteine O-methyltransferase Ste14
VLHAESGGWRIGADHHPFLVFAGSIMGLTSSGIQDTPSASCSSSGIPLALGSREGLIPARLMSTFLVVRAVLEDRTLQAELPAYKEYAQRVRYRLVPGAW